MLVRLVVVLLLAFASGADASTVRGIVYADTNRDGMPSAGEPGVPGVFVAWGVSQYVMTDANGAFQLEVPDVGTRIVWARVPAGYEPGPVWLAVPATAHIIDLGLRPLRTPVWGPVTFVAAADTHIYDKQPYFGGADLELAADRATAIHPAFFTILGDITQGDTDHEFDLVDAALAGLDVPFVPVPGNHDWYDNGATWSRRYGPDNYSFDVGHVHFIVWNLSIGDNGVRTFLGAELANVAPDMTIVALTHAPPSQLVIEALRDLHVDYLLTGHTHQNRIFDHGGLIELSTEPFLMGGLDFTPAGYRVVTIENRRLTTEHHSVVGAPLLEIVAPAQDGCVPAAGGQLIAAAELDAGADELVARIDDGAPIVLGFVGGWNWRASLPPLSPGPHALVLDARSTTGTHTSRHRQITTCMPDPVPDTGGDWSQVGGGGDHVGARACAIPPPLTLRWTQTLGGHVLQSSPVIANGVAFVSTTDLGDGDRGGVVAIDVASGAMRWTTRVAMPIRGAPAVVGDTVAVARVDGTILGLDIASGVERWHTDLGAGLEPQAAAIFASVATDGTNVLVGNQRRFGPLAADTGAPRWLTDPVREGHDSQSLGAIAISTNIAVGVFERLVGGVMAWNAVTGVELWHLPDHVTAINAAPVIADGLVYIANGVDEVLALDLFSGDIRWRTPLDPAGFDWGNATVGTPAIARGVLVVPTLYRDLVALDALTGAELWRFAGQPSPLRTTHYRGAHQAGFEASPVITGDIVWAADTSGQLSALDLTRGTVLWQTSLQTPVLAGLAATGDWLVVASYDGTMRAFSPSFPRSCGAPPVDPSCRTGGEAGPLGIALALVVLTLRRPRRCAHHIARP